MSRFNPLVYSSRPVLLQRLLDAVAHGYVHWTTGSVTKERLAAFASKMAAIYSVNLDRNRRFRNKAYGRGNAKLILYCSGVDDGVIRWWLLVTDGDHPARAAEHFRDALKPTGRIVVDGFELVRLPPKSGRQLGANPEPAWTWRMTGEKYQAWRDSIIQSVRSRTPEHKLHDLLHALYWGSPGYAGVRRQIGQLAVLYRSEWKRRRGNEVMVPLPKTLGYVRRLPDQGIRLYALVDNQKTGAT